MKKIRTMLCWMLCVSLLLAAGGVLAEEAQTRVFRLGTSAFTIDIPESVEEMELPEEAAQYGMVAYLCDVDAGLFMDIYQYDKESHPISLSEFVEQEAAQNNGTDVMPVGMMSGFVVGWFTISGTPDNPDSPIFYLVLEDEKSFIEIGFSMTGEPGGEEAKAIMASLKQAG